MSQQGALLQNFNNELVKCIEDLCVRRDDLQGKILEDEDEKRKLENDLIKLADRLSSVNESLSRKLTTLSEFDRTITETEAAYTKILESSHTLLSALKNDSPLTSASPSRHSHHVTSVTRSPLAPSDHMTSVTRSPLVPHDHVTSVTRAHLAPSDHVTSVTRSPRPPPGPSRASTSTRP